MVVSGMLNKQIAAEIGTTENTVKVHRSRAMEKMQAKSVPHLVKMVERLKIPPKSKRLFPTLLTVRRPAPWFAGPTSPKMKPSPRMT
jgi:Bacterial regulatory proteins, luxR family